MKLHLGFMSNKELAQWFGITLSQYNNRRQRYIISHVGKATVLDGYCKYAVVRGGVEVQEIYVDKYQDIENKELKKNRDERQIQREQSLKRLLGERSSYGIYAIYEGDVLIYIGKTMRSFEQRWQEHREIINGEKPIPKNMILYQQIKKQDRIRFKVLVDVTKLKTNKKITDEMLEAMELGFIEYYQPIGNYMGIKKEYAFSNK